MDRAKKREKTHQQSKSHDTSASDESEAAACPVDEEHVNDGASGFERALNPASKQGHAVTEPEGLEQRGEVVFHGRGAAEMGQELEERRTPHARKEAAVREQRDPGEARVSERGNRALDA